ncbi:sodium- and chloride-dependent glycine transporter 2-like [Ornithodoros turicata]|uniref:sodium- and chloride-dependent glycine transporter 2-like n=1 Tax=Ornithodoros turicata TaxID=34597 RepID=UPI0031393804
MCDERAKWEMRSHYILASLGSSVGAGWLELAATVRDYGGMAFLLAHVTLTVLVAMPLFALEMSLGQFAGIGLAHVFQCCPVGRGLGISLAIAAFVQITLQSMSLAYTLASLWQSIGRLLLWDDQCPSIFEDQCTSTQSGNGTGNGSAVDHEFYLRPFPRLSTGPSDIGGISVDVVICFFLAWLPLLVLLRRSVDVYGKYLYILVTVPLALAILSVIALFVSRATFLRSQWKVLADYTVWCRAVEQSLDTLALGRGVVIALASFKNVHDDVIQDTTRLTLMTTTVTYVLCTVGLTKRTRDVRSVWAILVWSSFYLLQLSDCLLLAETLLVSLADATSVTSRKARRLSALGISVAAFILALPLCFYSGPYYMELLEKEAVPVATLFLCLLELIVINFGYGTERFAFDVSFMLQRSPSRLWVLSWRYICWPLLVAALVCRLCTGLRADISLLYEWSPALVLALSLILVVLLFMPSPIWAYFLCQREPKGLAGLLEPNPHWGPAEPEAFNDYRRELFASSRRLSIVRRQSSLGTEVEDLLPRSVIGVDQPSSSIY